jgi:photosystem II stability/assembly factor-like uncharacterized protein
MKKISILVVLLGLLACLMSPVSASANLIMFSWVHTSDGMGEGNPATYPDTYAFAFSPNYATDHTMYAGTYIGVYRSTDNGLTWTNKLSSTLPAINSISVSPADPTGNTMIAGVEDGILQTTNRWDNYSGLGPGGLGVTIAVYSPDYVNDHMIYAGTDNNGIRAMTNTTPWWSIDEGAVLGKVTGIVFDANYSVNHILYVASYGHGVYKGDGGATLSSWSWTELNTGLDTANKKFVNAIAISPNFSVDQTLLIASDSVGIYKSTDKGGHWNAVYDTSAFQTLLFSPYYSSDRTIYAGEGSDGVFRSKDAGATWQQMNQGFADPAHAGSVLSLAFAPGKPIHLFAGFTGGPSGGVWQFLFPPNQVFVPFIKK